MANDIVQNGKVVSIHYTLQSNGETVENTEADSPLEYLHGAENIVPGLETALNGKRVGDKFNVTLEAEDAYGEYDEEAFETVARADLPDEVEIGMELLLEDEDGDMFEVIVSEITDDSVVLDFNAPLAGMRVTFNGEIVAIRDADADELDHGHPHSYADDFEYADEA
jgi:FKBP-type peptidyl-prolyl cis-trans isomerase SlyD